MTTAGQLRETVELQSPPAIADDSGGQVGGWTSVARLHAAVVPLSGTEALLAGAETSITRYKVTIRLRAIDSGQRLLWRGLALDVRSVMPRSDRAFVDLLCDATLL